MHDPIAPLDVLATNRMFRDPALADLAEPELIEYRTTRDLDALKPRLRPDAPPTVFVVKRLPAAYVSGVLRGMSAEVRDAMAFLAACHCVRLPGGAELAPAPKEMTAGAYGTQTAPDAWLDAITRRFGHDTVEEIGRVAYEFARLREDAKGPFGYRHG